MELVLMKDLLIILGISIAILLLGYRFNLPPIVGFLLTGVIAGPHGWALIGSSHDVETLAEIGIILLLFGIGMEFSLKKLMKIGRLFLSGGTLQVSLTILFGFLIALLAGNSWREGIFFGCLACMSSTAIVLGFLEQKGESASPHGKVAIAILVFQDMVAIPMILLLPLLATQDAAESTSTLTLLVLLLKGLAILGVVFFSAQKLVPRLLLLVARTRNKELFLLSVIALCFGVAWLTSSLGLSLSIGAFLAGLIISESEYSNEAVSNIFPFQALFISFFFISIGMLLDIHFVLQHYGKILGFALLAFTIKILSGGLTAWFLGLSMRTIILVAIALCQIGEFAFVLAKTGLSYGLFSENNYQLFLAVSLLTMGLSPFLLDLAPRFVNWCADLPWLKSIMAQTCLTDDKKALENHVIIVGFGISGKNLARSCKNAGVPYTVLEMNPDTVREQKRQGEPIQFGDATNATILEKVHLANAKALAVLANDPLAARRIIKIARQENPQLYIIVRARYMQETSLLHMLGADEVIPDEFGSSIEIFSRVLRQYHVPDEEIFSLITDIRADGYELLRNKRPETTKLSEIKLDLEHVEIHSLRLQLTSTLVGKSLIDSQLRHTFGVTVLLIKRGDKIFYNPDPATILMENDVLVVVGEKASIDQSQSLFSSLKNLVPAT